ncbi:MAG: ABC transporter ATP-binding protein [Bifidobacteriaceae bacterium]|nr:ABC transporter ATP-binding protein [Bifidobacteriaceae bacterium]
MSKKPTVEVANPGNSASTAVNQAADAVNPAPDNGIRRRDKLVSSQPPAVSIQDLSITYRTTFEKVPTLRSAVVRLGRGERAVREVHALQHLSVDVPVGTSLGIIGANGAGKSTLVRAVAGILAPSSGRIEVRGRISSLLALGVGFNPKLTGRENVVLGGLAQGMSRAQVADRAQAIAEFADIGEFMDMPLITYSSGMATRLAFAVGVHMDPDILMIDEALSAGDAQFKVKAAKKMEELMESARAMFLVSHSLGSVRDMCNDCIWIHKGKLMLHAEPQKCIDAYTKFLEVGENAFTMDDL